MQLHLSGNSISELWPQLLTRLIEDGMKVAPRGLGCRELLGVTLRIEDARRNLFVSPVRKVAYRFAVAEWLWIYFGHDDVATISPYNPHLAQFSDDGVTFAGAYGPPVWRQWINVVSSLVVDPDSRQAVIEIPRVHGSTRDQPCTLALQFLVRQGQLHAIATMRSSDVWLGVPYDVFTFSMLANLAAAQLHVGLGSLTMQFGSSHLYDTNHDQALQALDRGIDPGPAAPLLAPNVPKELEDVLVHRVRGPKFEPPWSTYGDVLLAPTNAAALEVLCRG